MINSKKGALEIAAEVAKAYGTGGSTLTPDYVIQKTYETIINIAQKEGFLRTDID